MRGVHFNEKLASSSALKNPSLLQQLMSFVALEDQDQYDSTISKDWWDVTVFPSWAYKEELAKAQQDMQRRREEENTRKQREALDFVSSSVSASSSRAQTPTTMAGGKVGRGSAAERVMAGLDRARKRSPHVVDTMKRKDNYTGGGRY